MPETSQAAVPQQSDRQERGFSNWAKGILAAVVAPVLIWLITVEAPKWFAKPTPPPPPAVQSTELDGIVLDGATGKVLVGAQITLTLNKNSEQSDTTSYGLFAFDVQSANLPAAASLIVKMAGYTDVSDQFSLPFGEVHKTVMIPTNIAAVPPAPPPPQPVAVPPAEHPAAAVAAEPVASYDKDQLRKFFNSRKPTNLRMLRAVPATH